MRRIVMVTAGLLACGPGFRAEDYPAPEALLAASIARFQAGDCDAARRGLLRLTFELGAQDPRMPDVRFYLAECQFQDGEYLGASREFRRVADEFPTHERAPAALLRAGESLARLWKRPELDPTHGEEALGVFRELLARYPASEAAGAARAEVTRLVDRFARKDLKTGDFYFRLRAYDSAIIYYRSVIQQWPESSRAPDALLKLVETYRRIGYDEEVRETCQHLRRFYPQHPGLADQCPEPSAP